MSSVAPISVKTGTVAPPDLSLTECEELAQGNEEARREVVNSLEQKQSAGPLTKVDQATLDKARGTGMTFSSASSRMPGAPGSFRGCSSGLAQEEWPQGLVEGGTSAQKVGLSKAVRLSEEGAHADAKEAAGVLCDKSHLPPGGGFGGHAEPKVMNHLTGILGAKNMRGGSVLFSIDWRSKKYGRSGMPCEHCFAMLCHAAKECDIRVFICSHDHQPVELSKSDCEQKGAYDDLCLRVDGNETPGRS